MIPEKSPSTSKKNASLGKGTLMLLIVILLGTAGCASESALERDYGKSWAYNQAVQIANPQAALVQTPAVGMSPKAATTNMEGYNKSFERKKTDKPADTFINLGGGSGSK